MNTWKVILATMMIFAAGVMTGGVLTLRLHRNHPELRQRVPPARAGQPPSPGGQRLEFLRRAQRELDLSPVQRERVDKILKESQERIRKLMEPLAPELRQEIDRTKQAFRDELTPEQQNKLDELLKKQLHPREPRRPAPGETQRQENEKGSFSGSPR